MTTAAVGGHISADELSDLPSASRNYMAFVGNVPGTVFIPSAEFLNDSFQANGQPTAANNIVFDGANNTDEQRGSNVGGQTRASNESIQEVQILTNQFDAEWGRASGAVINAVTKSGTNQITGSAFNFYTSKAMTNRDFFAKVQGAPKPDVGKKEWGGTDRRPDRAEQTALLRQPRAAVYQPELQQHVPGAPLAQLRDIERRVGVEHVVAHRPSAEQQAHVGVPLAARERAAVQSTRRRPGNIDELRRRDRPRPDAWSAR